MPTILSTTESDGLIMSNETLGPDDAQAALSEVDRMQASAADVSEESTGTKVALALIAGALVATPMADNSRSMVALLMAGLAIVLSTGRQKRGASALAVPRSTKSRIAMSVVVAFAVSMYVGGIVLRDRFDLSWGPLLLGAVLASVIMVVTLMPKADRA